MRTERALVSGGAGLVGSNLCRALLATGMEVVCVDNLSTSDGSNLDDLDDLDDLVGPASPRDYASSWPSWLSP